VTIAAVSEQRAAGIREAQNAFYANLKQRHGMHLTARHEELIKVDYLTAAGVRCPSPTSALLTVTNPARTPRPYVHLQVVSDGRADGRASVSDSPPAPGAKSKGKKGKGKKAEGGKVRPWRLGATQW